MPDGIQILGVYTHVTDCEEEDGENKSCLRSNFQIDKLTYYCDMVNSKVSKFNYQR